MSVAISDGQCQTRLSAQGQDAFCEPAGQLFYMVGRDALLWIPGEEMQAILEEMRLLEAVVERQQEAVTHLQSCQNKYIQVKQENYLDPVDRVALSEAENAEELRRQVIEAQITLDTVNQDLHREMEPLTQLSDNTNHIVEMIPIQRRGGAAAVAGFKMTYVRSEKIKNHWRKYQLTSQADTTGGGDSIITEGRIDWRKLKRQITDIKSNSSIKTDIPWFDDWTKLDEQSIELFQWSEKINEDLRAARSIQTGNEHDPSSLKVDLSSEAQLMRWSYGASGVSGEFNPFKKTASIKASGHTELVLAEAKASIDCYEPPGGYMMAFADINLGMLRSHIILSASGGVGASIAAELNIDVDFSSEEATARGIRGLSRSRGVPGEQTVDMSLPDNSQGAALGAFVGGQLEATFAGQIEWKSPESNSFEPFAKIAPGVAAQLGFGGQATFKISYQGGKFRIFARAALCYGAGAKGQLLLEVDAGLIYDFAKWVAYQLKNINYNELTFIEPAAFRALANIIYMAIAEGKELFEYMKNTAAQIASLAAETCEELLEGVDEALTRGALTSHINSDPDILKYTPPEVKGGMLYLLIQQNNVDSLDPRNRTYDLGDPNLYRAGKLTERKRAIIRIFTWVQSKREFDSIMKRVTPRVGEEVPRNEGYQMISDFLGLGEWTALGFFSSNYVKNLDDFYNHLRDEANKGSPIIKNDMEEYLTQNDIDPTFSTPCGNFTKCVALA